MRHYRSETFRPPIGLTKSGYPALSPGRGEAPPQRSRQPGHAVRRPIQLSSTPPTPPLSHAPRRSRGQRRVNDAERETNEASAALTRAERVAGQHARADDCVAVAPPPSPVRVRDVHSWSARLGDETFLNDNVSYIWPLRSVTSLRPNRGQRLSKQPLLF